MNSILTKEDLKFLNKNGIEIKSAIQDKIGISNRNYLINEKYFLKCGDKNFYSFSKPLVELTNLSAKHHLCAKVISFDRYHLLSEYIPNLKSLTNEISSLSKKHLDEIIKAIKAFHSLNFNGLEKVNYSSLLSSFRNKLKEGQRIYLPEIESFLNERQKLTQLTLSHLDLVTNNIMFTESKKVLLFDYEFACIGMEYFDITSLISECEFTTNDKLYLIHLYFDNEEKEKYYLDNLDKYLRGFDLIWYHWAYLRYLKEENKKKKEVFQQIYLEKKRFI